MSVCASVVHVRVCVEDRILIGVEELWTRKEAHAREGVVFGSQGSGGHQRQAC